MIIRWINHACFQIKASGKTIYTDPYEINKGEDPADVVLATHDHYDHFDEKSLKNIAKKDTVVVCPENCAKKAKGFDVRPVTPGSSVKIGDINVLAVPAYNPTKKFHPKGNNWVGYIVEVEGKRIYHAGDTDKIPEMENLGEVDVAMLPVGDTYTMGFEEAAEAAKLIKPKVVVPMHHWDKDLEPFKKMVEGRVPGVTVEILIGKDLEI
ncbi:MAG: MBL fold metallo-hydrolase [Promethearchaeota archaeon]